MIFNEDSVEKGKSDPEIVVKNLETVLQQSRKISDFNKELLSFSRKEIENFEVSNFNTILNKVMQFTKKDVRYPNVIFEINLYENLHDIACLESRIEQVVVNLINNARYALWKKYGESAHENKKIIITTQNVEREGKLFSLLSLKDLGTGIPAEKLKQIFEPFFTTKPKKEGTGLGLSIVYQIIENHGGKIEVNS